MSQVEGTGFIYKGYEHVMKPVRGSAAFWIDLDDSHTEAKRSMHGGCPIFKGCKWFFKQMDINI